MLYTRMDKYLPGQERDNEKKNEKKKKHETCKVYLIGFK